MAGRSIDPMYQNNPLIVEQNFKKGGCDEIEQYFFYKYYNLAISRFEWINLPSEIEPFFLEDVMFWRGKGVMIFDDVVQQYAFMRVNLTGLMDIYNVPSDRYAFANTGYLEEYSKDESVLLYNNPLTMPTFYAAKMYAHAMANLWNTRDINIFAQRTPVIMAMNESDKLSYENIITKYNQYLPVIKVDTSIDMKNLQVLNIEAPYIVDKLEQEMLVLESQYLSELGIESNPTDKKERLVTSEVDGNNGKTEMYRNTAMATRERFANACNDLWGTNIKIKFRSALPTALNLGVEGGEQNGSVGYNTNNTVRENNSKD